jgi:glutaredoxin 3
MIYMYTRSNPYCAYCERAKAYLKNKNIEFEILDVSENEEYMAEFLEKGHRSFPAIYVDGEFIGGFGELVIKVVNDKK